MHSTKVLVSLSPTISRAVEVNSVYSGTSQDGVQFLDCDDEFCVNLTGLRNTKIAGKTLFQDVSARGFLEEVSI